MSETASASPAASTGASAAPSAPTSTPSATPAASSTSTPGSTQPQATPGANAGAETAATAPRELGDTDLDALVTVQINGEIKKVPLKELQKGYQLETAARKRMTEAQKALQRAKQIEQMLMENPTELFKLAGKDFDQIAEERLAAKYERMQLSPVERENLELKERMQAQERAEMQTKKSVIEEIKAFSDKIPEGLEKYSKEDLAQYRDHLKTVHDQANAQLQQEIVKAWDEVQLPKNKRWGIMIAREMLLSKNSPTGPLQAKDAAAKVKSDWLAFNREIFSQMDATAILEALGKDVSEKVREGLLQRASEKQTPAWASANQTPNTGQSAPKKFLNQMEWRKAMGIG